VGPPSTSLLPLLASLKVFEPSLTPPVSTLLDKLGGQALLDAETFHLPWWIGRTCHIQEADGRWVPVDLWPMQIPVVEQLQTQDYLIVLKARQLGLTWLCVFEALYRMLKQPGLQLGVYSLREEEAVAVLHRMRDVYERMPTRWAPWGRSEYLVDNDTHWKLPGGSAVRALSARSGDSYTFGFVLVDEADLLDDLGRLLRSAEPTLSGGGQMRLISRANKDTPRSLFKAMYRAARDGKSKYRAVFLPWWARPDRDKAWYDREAKQSQADRGNLDFVYEQYPATEREALAPGVTDKRFPMAWVDACFREVDPVEARDVPDVSNLVVWAEPQEGRRYFVGADPAEGNPTSDASALVVMDERGVQAAEVNGRLQPAQLAHAACVLAAWYNKAAVLPERNNHGHAFILACQSHPVPCVLLCGPDERVGWLSTPLGNARLYDSLGDSLRNGAVAIHSRACADQLQTIRGADLSAPEGMPDDLADAFALADMARLLSPRMPEPTFVANPNPVPAFPLGPPQATSPSWWGGLSTGRPGI
jgi:hypothetical protein